LFGFDAFSFCSRFLYDIELPNFLPNKVFEIGAKKPRNEKEEKLACPFFSQPIILYDCALQVYAKATIPATDKVCLWLGANVMLEYTLGEKYFF
jgi:hypothetical protein